MQTLRHRIDLELQMTAKTQRYSAVTFSAVEQNATTESIFTSYKFVRPSALEETCDDE